MAPRHYNFRRMSGVAVTLVLVAQGGCGPHEPFHMVPVSGKVCFEDGTRIPAKRINVQFIPLAEPIAGNIYPRSGAAEVDVATGRFHYATSHFEGDGVVAGRHRVLITSYDVENLPTAEIPACYRDLEHSPLEVDAGDAPFVFKVPQAPVAP